MAQKRRIFLINKKFQFRFAIYVCTWLITLSLAYPLIIYNLFDYFIHYLSLDPMGPVLTNLQKTREDLLKLLITMQLILLSIAFMISIFMSHRIAGPLYKLRLYFKEAAKGNFDHKLAFRRSDYFLELPDDYNQMMSTVRSLLDQKNTAISLAIPALEKLFQNTPGDVRPEIEAALIALKASQKPQ